MKHNNDHKSTLILAAGEGRHYDCGQMKAIFKADENETAEKYSVSEWWLEPQSEGPGAHSHANNDEVFYVLEGTINFLVGDRWVAANKGAFLRIPATVTHDFRNLTAERAGLLNFYIPGGFEREMPAIVQWFADNPA